MAIANSVLWRRLSPSVALFFVFTLLVVGLVAATDAESDSEKMTWGETFKELKDNWYITLDTVRNIVLGIVLVVFGVSESAFITAVGAFLSSMEACQFVFLMLLGKEHADELPFGTALFTILNRPESMGNQLYMTLAISAGFAVIAAIFKKQLFFIMSTLGGINVAQWLACLFPVSSLSPTTRIIFFFTSIVCFSVLPFFYKNFFNAFSSSFDGFLMLFCALDIFVRSGFYLRLSAFPTRYKIDKTGEQSTVILVFAGLVFVLALGRAILNVASKKEKIDKRKLMCELNK